MTDEFVDTNILVYAHDVSAGSMHHRSADLLRRLSEERIGAVSVQVFIEFYSASTRKLPLGSEIAEESIRGFARWNIHRPGHADILRAIELQRRYKIQWWDALILNSAIQLGCSVLWTEDFNNGQKYESVTVRNPFV